MWRRCSLVVRTPVRKSGDGGSIPPTAKCPPEFFLLLRCLSSTVEPSSSSSTIFAFFCIDAQTPWPAFKNCRYCGPLCQLHDFHPLPAMELSDLELLPDMTSSACLGLQVRVSHHPRQCNNTQFVCIRGADGQYSTH